MTRSYAHSPFEGALDVVATLSERAIKARLAEMREDDKLTVAIRQMLRQGVSVNDISAATGLTCQNILKRTERELHFGEDVTSLSGC